MRTVLKVPSAEDAQIGCRPSGLKVPRAQTKPSGPSAGIAMSNRTVEWPSLTLRVALGSGAYAGHHVDADLLVGSGR